MSERTTTLFEMFGNFTTLWPVDVIQETTGVVVGDPPEVITWLAGLNAAASFKNVRMGAIDGHAALEADVAGFEAAQGWLFAGGKRERPGRLQGATTVQKGEQTGDSEQALVDLMVGAAIGPGPVRA